MQKTYFHNYQSLNKNKDSKKLHNTSSIGLKSVVDINILLNRVKIEAKNEIKRKIIFFSFIILMMSLFGALITIIK